MRVEVNKIGAISNFSTFSLMVSSELGLANNVYHVKSMMNTNFILSCKRAFFDVLEGVVLCACGGKLR